MNKTIMQLARKAWRWLTRPKLDAIQAHVIATTRNGGARYRRLDLDDDLNALDAQWRARRYAQQARWYALWLRKHAPPHLIHGQRRPRTADDLLRIRR